jgi:Tol biopolymer transport system component
MNENGAKLAVFDANGGAPRVLDLNGTSYRWTPDGSGIVFITADGKAANVYLLRVSDGQVSPVTRFTEGSIANLDVAANGRILLTHFVEMRDVVLLSN